MKNRKSRIEILVDEELKKKIKNLAKKKKITVSKYIRDLIKYSKLITIDLQSHDELSYELSKIGNNLNQIARNINIYKLDNSVLEDIDIENEIITIKNVIDEIRTKTYQIEDELLEIEKSAKKFEITVETINDY